MMRRFNTEGHCNPQKHYMIKLDERLHTIKDRYVDEGSYFIINRGRQYGKTTTLRLLAEYLKADYGVLAMDFQKLDSEQFRDGAVFSRAFAGLFFKALKNAGVDQAEELAKSIEHIANQSEETSLTELFVQMSALCEKVQKPIVLIIDEVDSASNNRVFLDFLSLLRGYYLDREDSPIFHSVILAGVYDIKNLRMKLRLDEEHQYNSPWNIAAEFSIEMDFTAEQIADMLREYELDHHEGMDIQQVAEEIYQYTSGYPYLVSAVRKIIDEELNSRNSWNKEGVAQAVNILLKTNIPLFGSMAKQLDIYSDLREMIEGILYQGKQVTFSPLEKSIDLGVMFGFLKEKEGHVVVANRIFEMVLLNLFLAEESIHSEAFRYGERDKNQFISTFF